MSSKIMIALGALAVIVGLTVMQFRAEEAADQRAQTQAISLPKIDVDQVDRLEIDAPEKGHVVLVKQDEGWSLSEPVQAKASQTAVEGTLQKLGELEATGVAANKTAHHATLEVSADKGTHLVAKQGEKVLADLWIGAYRSGNTMVRQEGEERVASVYGSVGYAFKKDVKDWRDRKVTDFENSALSRITLQNSAGEVVLERDGEDFKLAEGQEPIERFDVSKARSVAASVARLTAVGFAQPDVTPEAAGTTEGKTARVTIELADAAEPGPVLLKLGEKVDGNYYLQRDGNPDIFTVSNFVGERFAGGRDQFVKPEAQENANAEGNRPPATKIYPTDLR